MFNHVKFKTIAKAAIPVLLISASGMLHAQASDESLTAEQIMDKAKQNGKGFEDMSHEVKMVLVDEGGDTTEREMLIKAMTDADGNAYSMSIFTAPRRENGISLLTVAEASGSDKQYLYLPSTKRVKRITGSNKSSSFRGSEFTFEDLADQDSKDYRFELVKQAACGEQNCYVIDRFPRFDESSYSRTQLWIESEHYRPVKAEFYDQDSKLLKTMETSGYELVEGQFWNPSLIVMSNHQSGKSTRLESMELKMNTGLKTSEFTELAMRSWR